MLIRHFWTPPKSLGSPYQSLTGAEYISTILFCDQQITQLKIESVRSGHGMCEKLRGFADSIC